MDTKDNLIEWAKKQGNWAQYLLSKCFENNIIVPSDIITFITKGRTAQHTKF